MSTENIECKSLAACHCWERLEVELAPTGLRLAAYLTFEPITLNINRVMPLVRHDGKKLRAGDLKFIRMNFCPWCGTPYRISAQNEQESGAQKAATF